MVTMKFGIATFVTDEGIRPGPLGRALEERGFDSLFVAEHSHIPASRRRAGDVHAAHHAGSRDAGRPGPPRGGRTGALGSAGAGELGVGPRRADEGAAVPGEVGGAVLGVPGLVKL